MNRILKYFSLIVLIACASAPSQAETDEGFVQLAYGFSADALSGAVYYSSSDKAPPDLQLPELNCDKPLFIQCRNSGLKAGTLWMAFDKSEGSDSYDTLYVDTNSDNSLKDEQPLKQSEDNRYGEPSYGPIKITLDAFSPPREYHIMVRTFTSSERLYAAPVSAGFYEGKLTLGEKEVEVKLIDSNNNGTFTDTHSDAVMIQFQGRTDRCSLGKMIYYDKAYYYLETADDGKQIKLSPADDIKTAKLTVPEDVKNLTITGDNGVFSFNNTTPPVEIPEGVYKLQNYYISKKDKDDQTSDISAYGFDERGQINAQADTEINLPVGQSFHSTLTFQQNGPDIRFSQQTLCNLGGRVSIYSRRGRPPAPKLHIRDTNGKYDKTINFEYG